MIVLRIDTIKIVLCIVLFLDMLAIHTPKPTGTLSRTTKIPSLMRSYYRIEAYFRHKGWLIKNPIDEFTLVEIEAIILLDEL